MKKISVILLVTLSVASVFAQDMQAGNAGDYSGSSWKQVATGMPSAWYGSEDAKSVAENVLLAQKNAGGWPKNQPYHHKFSESEKAAFIREKAEIGATFDNGATITELKFLAKVYSHFKDDRYKESFEKGLDYIFLAQYGNGGWPQFFPVRESESVKYSGHITYNDNAMVNIMQFLGDLSSEREPFVALQLTDGVKARARKAFDAGVKCILDTQIIVKGQPTVWCAQHDEKNLLPAKARKYELPSFSGSESVGIVLLLMKITNPSEAVAASVNGAVNWFKNNKIEGIKLEKVINREGKQDLMVVKDEKASPLWARFYDLETNKPFFCDRDGVKRSALSEIGYERRNGYAWYTDAPAKLLRIYPEWRKTHKN